MMIEILSYIKSNDQFIAVENIKGPLDDDFYIEGAILLTVDEKPILTLEHWDLVDVLWAYLVGLMDKISKEKTAKTSFSDQSIELGLERVFEGKRIKIWVKDGQDCNQAIIDRIEFFTVFCNAGTIFFKKMAQLIPNHAREYEAYGERLKNLS